MPSKEELKKELHTLIDSIEDENILNVLHEEVAAYTKEKDIEEDDLTDEQWAKMQRSIQQAKDGQTITVDELFTKMKEWRTR